MSEAVMTSMEAPAAAPQGVVVQAEGLSKSFRQGGLNVDVLKGVDIRIGVLSNLVMNKHFRDKRHKLEHVLGVTPMHDEFEVDDNLVEELV